MGVGLSNLFYKFALTSLLYFRTYFPDSSVPSFARNPADGLDESDYKLIALLILGICFGIAFFIMGLRKHGWIRLIENIPTSTVRAVAIGLAEVKGKAFPMGEVLVSPFARKACVYYQYKVKKKRRNGRHSYWATVAKGESNLRFLLRDETGELYVSPVGARTELAVDQRYSNTWLGDGMPGQVYQALEELKVTEGHLFSSTGMMKIEESFVEPGDEIYVMGTADTTRVTDPSISSSGIVINKGENGNLFYISDKSEKELLKTLRVRTLLEVYGGAALCLGSLGIFVKLYLANFVTGSTQSYFATLT